MPFGISIEFSIKRGKATKIEEEVPIEQVPKRIRFEITQQKDIALKDGQPAIRTVLLKRGKFNKKKPFVDWRGKRFFPDHILKETQGKKVRYLVRWNVNYSEAMDKDGKIQHSKELNNLLLDDMMFQFRKAVGSIGGFVFDRTILTILLMAMIFGVPIGLSYNDIFHWVPNTVIHWIPRA